MKNLKIAALVSLSFTLSACSGFFDKDNTPLPTPLTQFRPETSLHSLWQTSIGSGVGAEYLKLVPAISGQTIFAANKNGTVTATNKQTGRNIWQVNTGLSIGSGVAARDNIVVVGSKDGDVQALRQIDGQTLWKARVSSEVLATPAIGEGTVLIKTIDGSITALSVVDGHSLWTYQEAEPLFILRGASTPKIYRGNVIVGFANGGLSRLTLKEGSQIWHQPIATPEGSFAIQRMIDIDADPIVFNNHVYAATYQGRVASLDFNTGKEHWNHDISSYIGITADNDRVYVSDAKSHLWAFEASTGNVFWRQTQLEYRNISGPTLIGNYVVVGDEQGYLHLMNKQDGHFVARAKVDNSGIIASPIIDDNIIYVLTKSGRLAAYTLG